MAPSTSKSLMAQSAIKSKSKPIEVEKKHDGWDLNREPKIKNPATLKIKDQLAALRSIESEVSEIDTYVKYCIDKYKPFMFNLQMFIGDKELGKAKFVECFEIPDGEFEGCLYWG